VAREASGWDTRWCGGLLAVTGYGHAEAVEAGCSAGFELHLTKPIDRDALEKMLSTLPHLAGP
jgi:hypothetical protein